jgi:uncharacterized protein YbaR (Trm112 family)
MLLLMPLWGYEVKLLLLCKSLNAGYFCLITIVSNKLKVDRSTYEILQILSISPLDKTPLNELLTNQNYKDVKELYCKRLKISWY